jgi:hypothetical protein
MDGVWQGDRSWCRPFVIKVPSWNAGEYVERERGVLFNDSHSVDAVLL